MGEVFGGLLSLVPAIWPGIVAAGLLLALIVVLRFPMPGRGPRSGRRDVWRGFRFEARRVVFERANGVCEAPLFLAWGRCGQPAVEVDHVYPWSKGGPTVLSNGQALCRGHNRSKSILTPPWWYIKGLERRRRGYFLLGLDVRVFAVMTDSDLVARAAWAARTGRQR